MNLSAINENLDAIENWKDTLSKCPIHYGSQILSEIAPNLQFIKYIRKGGEAILVQAFDEDLQVLRAIKIAFSAFNQKGRRVVNLQSLVRYTVEEINELRNRFLRGSKIQAFLAEQITEQYGKIPTVYHISPMPTYVIMDFVQGQDLIQWSLDKQFRQITDLFCKILLLVNCVHDFLIVHSDISPANLLVTEDLPVLLDFTLSKRIDRPEESITTLGIPLGTEQYASPTMMRDAKMRSFTDDVYCLGRVYLAMFFRRPIKRDEELSLMELPEGLRHILQRATQKSPNWRYKTISPFLKDLLNYLKSLQEEPSDIGRSLPESEIIIEENSVILSIEDQEDLKYLLGKMREERNEREQQNIQADANGGSEL